MVQIIKISLIIFATIVWIAVVPVSAQNECKVLLDQIASRYTGDCKKGLAEGSGSAQGEDKYEVEINKGRPNGAGVYTLPMGMSLPTNTRKDSKMVKAK
jgi:hypothetical protein